MGGITVRQEVEAILKLTRQRTDEASAQVLEAVSQSPVTDAAQAVAAFHGDVLAELDKIIQRYIDGDQPAEAEVVTPPRRLEIKVGDKVRLTGDQWERDVHGYAAGDVVTIDKLSSV